METQQFLEAMSRMSTAVNVVTTDGSAGRAGVTVSSMCSVSADRPTVLACVHHLSPAAPLIEENGVFCINVLTNEQAHISNTFAGRVKPGEGDDKFSCAKWHPMATGAPALVGSLISFDCTLVEKIRWDTHYIFLGEVVEVEHNKTEGVLPLLYTCRSYAEPKFHD